MSTATVEPTALDCVKCGDELTEKLRPLCMHCVDDAVAADDSGECAHCRNDAEVCESCAHGDVSVRVREYAERRRMLGLMSPEIFAAFELCAEDLEAVHG